MSNVKQNSINKRNAVMFAIVLSVLVVGGWQFWLRQKNQNKWQNFDTRCSVKSLPNLVVRGSLADWRKYKNDRYGFSLQYPPSAKISQDQSYTYISVNNNSSGKSGPFIQISHDNQQPFLPLVNCGYNHSFTSKGITYEIELLTLDN